MESDELARGFILMKEGYVGRAKRRGGGRGKRKRKRKRGGEEYLTPG